jgi:hypothetical protein
MPKRNIAEIFAVARLDTSGIPKELERAAAKTRTKIPVQIDVKSFKDSLKKLEGIKIKPVKIAVEADTTSFRKSLTQLSQTNFKPVTVAVQAKTTGAKSGIDKLITEGSAKDIDIKVKLDVDKSPLSQIGKDGVKAGSSFMSGFGDKLSFLANPAGLKMTAVILAAAATAGPLIGAVLGGGIVTGLGAGLIAAAITKQLRDPQVEEAADNFRNKIFGLSKEDEAEAKAKLEKVLNNIDKIKNKKSLTGDDKSELERLNRQKKGLEDTLKMVTDNLFSRATISFKQPLIDGFEKGTDYLLKFEKRIKGVFDNVVKSLKPIADGLKGGFEGFLPGIEALSSKLQPFMKVTGEGFERIGTALGNMFKDFANDPAALAGMVKGLETVFGLIVTTINVFSWLVRFTSSQFLIMKDAWGKVANFFTGPFVNALKDAWAAVVSFFGGVGKWFSDRWTSIKTAFTDGKNAVVNTWNNLWNTLKTKSTDFMTSIRDGIMQKVNSVKGFFSGLWNNVTSTFKSGVDKVSGYVNTLKKKLDEVKSKFSSIFGSIKGLASTGLSKAAEAARNGLNGMIGFINKGINALNKPLDWVNLKIPTIGTISAAAPKDDSGNNFKGFATGGAVFGKGTATSDSINARLSNGEHVWTAREVEAIGGQSAMYALRRMARSGALKPGGTGGDVSEGIVTQGFKNGGAITERIGETQKWIRAQAGKPYIWASSGPRGYDCSGLVGAVYNMLRGENPHQRVFSTSNQQNYFKNGKGTFTAGYAHPGERGASSGVGHTAGNLAGLAFESRGSKGVLVGSQARSVDSFQRQGYMPQVGNKFIGGGGNGDIFGYLKDQLTPLLSKLWEGMPALGILGEFVQKSMKKFAGAIPGKVFDNGGMLTPGGVGINLGKKPEAVLTPKETRAYQDIAANGGGMVIHGDLVIAPEISTVADLLTVKRLEKMIKDSARGNGYSTVTA